MNTIQRSDIVRSKPFLLSVGCFVAIILLTMFVVIPQLTLFNEKRVKIEQTKKDAAAFKAKADELSTIDKTKIATDYQLSDRVLPSALDIPSTIESISGLADESGLSITSLNSSGSVEGSSSGQMDPAQSVSFKLSMIGSRNGAENFLQFYEKAYPLFTLENIHITNTTSGVSEFTAIVKSYSKANPQTIGDIQTPLPVLSDSDKTTLASLGGYSKFTPLSIATNEATPPGKRKNPFSF